MTRLSFSTLPCGRWFHSCTKLQVRIKYFSLIFILSLSLVLALASLLLSFFLTIPRYVQLDEVLKVLYLWRQLLDLVVAQAQLAKAVETKKVLKVKKRENDN